MSVRPLARGGAFGLATMLVEKATALLLLVLLARALGPDDFGVYAFVIAYLTLFQVLAYSGLEPTLLRRLAEEPEDRAPWLGNAILLRLGLALVSGALAVGVAPLAVPGADGLRGPVAISAAGLLLVGQPGFRALLRAEGRLDAVFGVAAATQGMLFAFVGLAIVVGAGLEWVLVSISAAHLLGFALGGWIAGRDVRPQWGMDRWGPLLREAWPVGANVFAALLGLRVAPILLMTFGGPAAVGLLGASTRLAEALNLFAEGLMLAVFPLLAAWATTRGDSFLELSRASAKILAFTLLTVALVLHFQAGEILALLLGPEFRSAGPVLGLLGWFAVLSGLGTLYTNQLVALGRARVLFGLNAISGLFQVVLQFFLVPRFGVEGAATGMLVGAAFNHAILCFLPATAPWIRPCLVAALPMALAAAVSALLTAVVGVPEGWAGAAGVVIFFGLVLGTGLLGPSDLHRLRLALAHSSEVSRERTSVQEG